MKDIKQTVDNIFHLRMASKTYKFLKNQIPKKINSMNGKISALLMYI